MKFPLNKTIFALASYLITINFPSLAQAPIIQNQKGFRCDLSSGVPTTIYQDGQGKQEPWIVWQSDYFAGSGWTPNQRCLEVSARLETYRRDKKLKYVTLGTINNQQVICVANVQSGPCDGIIYTLKPGQDGLKALNNLFTWRQKGAAPSSNYESVTEIPYIDVGSKLNETISNPPSVNWEQPTSNVDEQRPTIIHQEAKPTIIHQN